MSSSLILFRSSNLNADGTKLIYNLPGGFDLRDGYEVQLHSMSMYNSFYNIDSTNNTFYIDIPNYSTTIPNSFSMKRYTIMLDSGFYSYSEMNAAMQQQMINQKICLYNSTTSKYLFFFAIVLNSTLYKIQLQSALIPNTAYVATIALGGSGYTQLPGADWNLNIAPNATAVYTGARICWPKSLSNFSKVLGYYDNTVVEIQVPSTLFTMNGSTTVTYASLFTDAKNVKSYLSNRAMEAQLVSSVCFRCNIVQNPMSIPNDLMSVSMLNGSYGGLCTYQASNDCFVPCILGAVTEIVLSLYDQNLNVLTQKDSEISVTLMLRKIKQT
jgi:hypothetical protein